MKITRRNFVQSLAIAGFPTIIPASVLGKNSPSNRITLACIGVGKHGLGVNLKSFLYLDEAQIVSVCDVFKSRSLYAKELVNKKYGTKGCKAYQDFRNIIEDKSIDAVVISTPDHWHVPLSVMALEAGKDVFSEKPTYTIAEGKILMDAVKKHNAVFQAGLEDRSLIHYHKMVEWVLNGAIGDLERVDVKLPTKYIFPLEKPCPVPDDLNYELFVGPAEFIPYTKSITGNQNWRMCRNFSGGSILDWGAHLGDTAQRAVNDGLPVEVRGTGNIPENSASTVPVTFDITYRYAHGAVINMKSGGTSIRFTGTKGWVGNDSWLGQLKASDPKILHTKYAPGTSKLAKIPTTEHRNFLACVKSRQPTTYTAEVLDQICKMLHMGLISIYRGKKLRWNAATDSFIDNPEANKMLSKVPREDWKKEKRTGEIF